MLTEDQIAEVLQDFYAYFIERDNKSRLISSPLTNGERQRHIDYWQMIAREARADLGGNNLGAPQ